MMFLNVSLILLVIVFVIVMVVGATGLGFWHAVGETGLSQVRNDVKERMVTAHAEGRYRDVVSLYEARHHVRFGRDWPPTESNLWSAAMTFRIAESYSEVGNDTAARQHYLALIGWTELEYQAHCRLGLHECSSDGNLRDLAYIKTGAAQ